MPHYDCDRCGACCRGFLIVEAGWLDVQREPRLIEADRHYRNRPFREVLAELEDETRCILVTGASPCRFLDEDDRCSIHPTRPNACVGMQAGDEQCQAARDAEGLPPLLPTSPLEGESP